MPSNTSSNKAVVPEAKGALDRFKYEVAKRAGCSAYRRIQRKPDFQTERIRRWIYGQKDD